MRVKNNNESHTKLNNGVELAAKTLKIFVDMYKDKYAFSQPELIYTPNTHILSVKIGTMEIEEFNKRMDEKDENTTDK